MAHNELSQSRDSPLACLKLEWNNFTTEREWRWNWNFDNRYTPSATTAVRWVFDRAREPLPEGYNHFWCKWCKYNNKDPKTVLEHQSRSHKPELDDGDICGRCHIANTHGTQHISAHCSVIGSNDEMIGRSWDPSLLQYRYDDPNVARVLTVEERAIPGNELSENAPRRFVTRARQFAIDSSYLGILLHHLATQQVLYAQLQAAHQQGVHQRITLLQYELRQNQANIRSFSPEQCVRFLEILDRRRRTAIEYGRVAEGIEHEWYLLQAHIQSLPGESAASLSKVLPSLTSRQQNVYRRSNPFF